MAAKKGKKKRRPGSYVAKGAPGLTLTRGKCRVVRGRVRVCVSKNGAISVSNAKVTKVKKAKKGSAAKTKAAGAPKNASTPKAARKAPRAKKSLKARLKQCKSPLFNNSASKTNACSCIIINSKGNPQVTPLSKTACVGSKPMRKGAQALKEFRKGGFRKSYGRQPKMSEVARFGPGGQPTIVPGLSRGIPGLSGVRRRRRRRAKRR